MKLIADPFISVGPFFFDKSVDDYQSYDFVFEPSDDKTEWSEYDLPEFGLTLYVENGLIVSINCNKQCWLNGINLIGYNIYEFAEQFGLPIEDREFDQLYTANLDQYQDVYEFDELGMQIWSLKGVIQTVICSPD